MFDSIKIERNGNIFVLTNKELSDIRQLLIAQRGREDLKAYIKEYENDDRKKEYVKKAKEFVKDMNKCFGFACSRDNVLYWHLDGCCRSSFTEETLEKYLGQ